MTRTVFLGEPDARLRSAYETLRRANEQVERALRKQAPETYNKIVQSVYRFSRGWMKIHNPVSTLQVTDALTPYEFSIAMLAAKGRSNKEIAALMGISVNTVKSYMESIFEKLQISSRNEIDAYVNR